MQGILRDEEILDQGFRSKMIEEIIGQGNVARKMRELRKYEVYKDLTKKWVIDALIKEGLTIETVAFMTNRATNLSICRKIIDKLARAYSAGVDRTGEVEADNAAIQKIEQELEVTLKMQKVDRYRCLHHNCVALTIPVKDEYASDNQGKDIYELDIKVLPPFMYDVIPDAKNNELGRVLILTDFTEQRQPMVQGINSSQDGRGLPALANIRGDGQSQTIADDPSDRSQDKREFIWWSERYHFTTNIKGEILPDKSPEGLSNPIGLRPWVNFAFDQDGYYWAYGGEDITDAAVLINTMLTDLNSIMTMQGWGQLVAKGHKDSMPKDWKFSPYKCTEMTYDQDQPKPELDYISSNPPVDAWIRAVEQQLAMVLSTNNIAAKSIAGKLDSQNAASGISKLLDDSEVRSDIGEAQEEYKDKEKEIWKVIKAWWDYYSAAGQLCEDLVEEVNWSSDEIKIKFNDQMAIQSESEKLANLKLRKDLGLDTMLELIKINNPSLDDEAAQKQLEAITKENAQKAVSQASQVAGNVAKPMKMQGQPNEVLQGGGGKVQSDTASQS